MPSSHTPHNAWRSNVGWVALSQCSRLHQCRCTSCRPPPPPPPPPTFPYNCCPLATIDPCYGQFFYLPPSEIHVSARLCCTTNTIFCKNKARTPHPETLKEHFLKGAPEGAFLKGAPKSHTLAWHPVSKPPSLGFFPLVIEGVCLWTPGSARGKLQCNHMAALEPRDQHFNGMTQAQLQSG